MFRVIGWRRSATRSCCCSSTRRGCAAQSSPRRPLGGDPPLDDAWSLLETATGRRACTVPMLRRLIDELRAQLPHAPGAAHARDSAGRHPADRASHDQRGAAPGRGRLFKGIFARATGQLASANSNAAADLHRASTHWLRQPLRTTRWTAAPTYATCRICSVMRAWAPPRATRRRMRRGSTRWSRRFSIRCSTILMRWRHRPRRCRSPGRPQRLRPRMPAAPQIIAGLLGEIIESVGRNIASFFTRNNNPENLVVTFPKV